MPSEFLARKFGEDGEDQQKAPSPPTTTTPCLSQTTLTLINRGMLSPYSLTTPLAGNLQPGHPFGEVLGTQLFSPAMLDTPTPNTFSAFPTGRLDGFNGAFNNWPHGNDVDMSGLGIIVDPINVSFGQQDIRFLRDSSFPTPQYDNNIMDAHGEVGLPPTGFLSGTNDSPWRSTSHCGQSANVNDQRHDMIADQQQIQQVQRAQVQFAQAFPNGFEILPTPTVALQCALFAIQLSFVHQFPRLRYPSIPELYDIATTGVVASKFFEAHGRPVDDHNYTVDHIAAVVKEYGRRQTYFLQLGVKVADQAPYIVFLEEGRFTLWIHNDNAQGANTLGHYSGLKPNKNPQQYDQTERSSLRLDDFPTTCRHCKRDRHDQHAGTYYQDQNTFLLHIWMAHPKIERWISCRCFWGGCTDGTLYKTPEDCLIHVFKIHQLWIPQPCPRGDCKHKVPEYPTAQKCIKHILSVHEKRCKCTYPGCKSRPFGTPEDLKKHFSTHEEKTTCNLPYCKQKRNMNRGDRKKEHMRDFHGPYCCDVEGEIDGARYPCSRGIINGQSYGFGSMAKLEEHKKEGKHLPVRL